MRTGKADKEQRRAVAVVLTLPKKIRRRNWRQVLSEREESLERAFDEIERLPKAQ